MAGYSYAKHACAFVSSHISKVTCRGRALILHLEGAKEKKTGKTDTEKERRGHKEICMKQVSHHQTTVKIKKVEMCFLMTNIHCHPFGCCTTVLRHFEVDVNRSNQLIFFA